MLKTILISETKSFRNLKSDESGWVFQIGKPIHVTLADFNGARSGMAVYNARKIGGGRACVSPDKAVYPTAEECQAAWDKKRKATEQLFASRREGSFAHV